MADIPNTFPLSESDYPTWDIEEQSDGTLLVSNIDVKSGAYECKGSGNDPFGRFWADNLSVIIVSKWNLKLLKVPCGQRIFHPAEGHIPDVFGYHLYCKVFGGYLFAEVNITEASTQNGVIVEILYSKLMPSHGVGPKSHCRFCPRWVPHPSGMDTINLLPYPGFNPLALCHFINKRYTLWESFYAANLDDENPVERVPLDRFDDADDEDYEDDEEQEDN